MKFSVKWFEYLFAVTLQIALLYFAVHDVHAKGDVMHIVVSEIAKDLQKKVENLKLKEVYLQS